MSLKVGLNNPKLDKSNDSGVIEDSKDFDKFVQLIHSHRQSKRANANINRIVRKIQFNTVPVQRPNFNLKPEQVFSPVINEQNIPKALLAAVSDENSNLKSQSVLANKKEKLDELLFHRQQEKLKNLTNTVQIPTIASPQIISELQTLTPKSSIDKSLKNQNFNDDSSQNYEKMNTSRHPPNASQSSINQSKRAKLFKKTQDEEQDEEETIIKKNKTPKLNVSSKIKSIVEKPVIVTERAEEPADMQSLRVSLVPLKLTDFKLKTFITSNQSTPLSPAAQRVSNMNRTPVCAKTPGKRKFEDSIERRSSSVAPTLVALDEIIDEADDEIVDGSDRNRLFCNAAAAITEPSAEVKTSTQKNAEAEEPKEKFILPSTPSPVPTPYIPEPICTVTYPTPYIPEPSLPRITLDEKGKMISVTRQTSQNGKSSIVISKKVKVPVKDLVNVAQKKVYSKKLNEEDQNNTQELVSSQNHVFLQRRSNSSKSNLTANLTQQSAATSSFANFQSSATLFKPQKRLLNQHQLPITTPVLSKMTKQDKTTKKNKTKEVYDFNSTDDENYLTGADVKEEVKKDKNKTREIKIKTKLKNQTHRENHPEIKPVEREIKTNQDEEEPFSLRRSKRARVDRNCIPIYEFQWITDFEGKNIYMKSIVGSKQMKNLYQFPTKAKNAVKTKKKVVRNARNEHLFEDERPTKSKPPEEKIKNKAPKKSDLNNNNLNTQEVAQDNNFVEISANQEVVSNNDKLPDINREEGRDNTIINKDVSLPLDIEEEDIQGENNLVNENKEVVYLENLDDNNKSHLVPVHLYVYSNLIQDKSYEKVDEGVYACGLSRRDGLIKLDKLAATKTSKHIYDITYFVQKGVCLVSINNHVTKHTTTDVIKIPKNCCYKIKNLADEMETLLYFQFNNDLIKIK